MDEKEIEALKHEYTEVQNNLRYYGSLRFAVMTVYFAIIVGISAVAFGGVKVEVPEPFNAYLMARVGGLIITLFFILYEYRLEILSKQKLKVAKALEAKLHYSQLSTRPEYIRTSWITLALYFVLLIFWVVAIWKA